MKPGLWETERDGLRYVVQRREFSNWAGSGYRFARNAATGFVRRFWLPRNAQRYADALNKDTRP